MSRGVKSVATLFGPTGLSPLANCPSNLAAVRRTSNTSSDRLEAHTSTMSRSTPLSPVPARQPSAWMTATRSRHWGYSTSSPPPMPFMFAFIDMSFCPPVWRREVSNRSFSRLVHDCATEAPPSTPMMRSIPSRMIRRTSGAQSEFALRRSCSQRGRRYSLAAFPCTVFTTRSLTIALARLSRTARCWSISIKPVMTGMALDVNESLPTASQTTSTCSDAALRTSPSGSRRSSQ
mmetsp:Transcript_1219/g.3050  ORF Transcript_1219/g.3050 Transcript_1219/m.3050 type:complete len:234 (+) Transcript_1219:753-1454(+)